MIRMQISLTEQQAEAIKQAASHRNVSMAEIIREGTSVYLCREPTAGAGDRVRRAIEVSGRFRSGQSDVADNHDRYLSESAAP